PIATLTRPTMSVFERQLDLVASWADLRDDRGSEILSQLGPQASFWGPIVNLQPGRMPWTLELVATVLRFCTFVEQRIKHILACRRPAELSARIQPMIVTPGHGALPSGHATEAFAVARVLLALAGDRFDASLDELLMRQAARIAINRTVAGVHFPVDSAAGQMLGLSIADYLLRRVGVDAVRGTSIASLGHWVFHGDAYPAADDFKFRRLYETEQRKRTDRATGGPGGKTVWAKASTWAAADAVETSALLQWLWDKAVLEWA
ncbi:MAG: phosphatase PAP2 family protein, partial [Burkholderiaceae bacterium]